MFLMRDCNLVSVEDIVFYLRSLDEEKVASLGYTYQRSSFVRGLAMHHKVDITGEYRLLYHAISRNTLIRYPCLRQYKTSMIKAFELIPTAAADHLVDILTKMLNAININHTKYDTSYIMDGGRASLVLLNIVFCHHIIPGIPVVRPTTDSATDYPYHDHLFLEMERLSLVELLSDLFKWKTVTTQTLGKYLMPFNALTELGYFTKIKEPISKKEMKSRIGRLRDRIKRVYIPYTDDDIQKLLTASEGNTKDNLIILFFRDIALRGGGLRHMRLCDVWDDKNNVPRRTCECDEKMGKKRKFTMTPALLKALGKYMEEYSMQRSLYLFPRYEDVPDSPVMTTNMLKGIGRRLAKKANVTFRGFHRVRHWKVLNLVQKGKKIEKISNWIGHSSVAVTTNSYYIPELDDINDDIELGTKMAESNKSSLSSKSVASGKKLAIMTQYRWHVERIPFLRDHVDAGCLEEIDKALAKYSMQFPAPDEGTGAPNRTYLQRVSTADSDSSYESNSNSDIDSENAF
jgi:integrase